MQSNYRAKMKHYKSLALKFVFFGTIIVGQVTSQPATKIKMASLDALIADQVVPDVIDAKPGASLEVIYPSGAKLQQGNELTPTQVKDMPEFKFNAEPNELYCLAMVDPDAPSRSTPTYREILHMLVANVPANEVKKGQTLAEYIGSGAPKGTGLHRYIVLLYKQTGGKIVSDMKTPKTSREGRIKFSIRTFAQKHNLTLVAANFFKAQYDDYVPILQAQLNG